MSTEDALEDQFQIHDEDDRDFITWKQAAERKGGLRVVLVTYDGRVWRPDGMGYADRIQDVGLYDPHDDLVLQNIGGTHSAAILVYPKDLPSLAQLKRMGRALFKAGPMGHTA